jgi:hypothetical protein
MNRYLEKVAKEYITEVRVEDTDNGRKLGAAVAGAGTAGIIQGKVGPALQKPIMNALNKWSPDVSTEVMEKIKEDVLPKTNTTLNIREVGGNEAYQDFHKGLGAHTGPHYASMENMESMRKNFHRMLSAQEQAKKVGYKVLGIDYEPEYKGQLDKDYGPFKKNYIHFGGHKNTDVLVHEMGHAVDLNKGNVKLKNLASNFSRRTMGLPSAAVGGAMLASDKTRDYAWMAPWVAAAPTLRDEFAANKEAYKLIKQHGGHANKYLKLGGANLLGYAAVPLLSSLALAGINHARKKGEEVNPDEWLKDRE